MRDENSNCSRDFLQPLTHSLTHHPLVGYPTPSMAYREARLTCFWRGLGRADQQAEAIQQHMNRALLTNGRNFNATHRLTTDRVPGEDTSTWVNNITRLSISRGGPDNHTLTMDTHIYEIPTWQPIAHKQAKLDICTLADLQGPNNSAGRPTVEISPSAHTTGHGSGHVASQPILEATRTGRTRDCI